jgi:hypothetical protein
MGSVPVGVVTHHSGRLPLVLLGPRLEYLDWIQAHLRT